MQSVATILMCCSFLLHKDWKEVIRKSTTSYMTISFVGIFLIYAISFFFSENKIELFAILKNKLPLIFIAISIISIEKISKIKLNILLYFFIFCSFFSSIWCYFQYQKNIEFYANLYAQGEVIPTIIHHVSFAVLLCFSVLFILNIIVQSVNKIKQFVLIILLVWFIYFIHILSVRTGIVLLYISIFLFALSMLIIKKKLAIAGGLMFIMIASAYFAYQKIPTIKSKIGYTIYSIDIYKDKKDTTNQVSDARRILSDKIGFEILQQHKYFGVGFGDIQDEMNKIYKQRYPYFKQDVYSRIHNQYLYVITSAGVIFGSIFCLLLLLPFIQFIKDKNIVFAIAYFLLLLLMLWESFLENQLGTSIFLWICCVGYVSKNND